MLGELPALAVVSILLPSLLGAFVEVAIASVAFYGARRLKSTGWLLVGFGAILGILFSLPWMAWNVYQVTQHPDLSRVRTMMTFISALSMAGRFLTAGLTVAGMILVIGSQVRAARAKLVS